jgi:succinate dehydrogenase/fumarate reductase flavoprotein subunit
MHGDLALVEASLSARAFFHLVNLGLPFPTDSYGQFVGYKTDHDPRQRATSIGPYTSREMCRALIRRAQELDIPVRQRRSAVQLFTYAIGPQIRIGGAVAVCEDGSLEVYGAENVIFAVGGPGGLYKTSVYPRVHTGAIGLALMAGAVAQNLPESQFGLASLAFPWNVSGTYMQVIPRIVSRAEDGLSDEREFLRPFFSSVGEMNSLVFMKGYQWPFDVAKSIGGSSVIDLLVYAETVQKGRRVFLDYRSDPAGFSAAALSEEARTYLERSDALLDSPLARLRQMNPMAVELYREHGIDLQREPLEVAVCAQHNNGGLAADHWWESTSIGHLFPVGEVNGSHGVYRPGGSALNAGQVGGFRAAEYIASRYNTWRADLEATKRAAAHAVAEIVTWTKRSRNASTHWQAARTALQDRMTRSGAPVRVLADARPAAQEAWAHWQQVASLGLAFGGPRELTEALCTRQLCFAHATYLDAIAFALQSGAGSRGSSIALDPDGSPVHPSLEGTWRIAPEDRSYRHRVLETWLSTDGKVHNRWVDRRPIPVPDSWFETTWARFREGDIYRKRQE